MNLLPCNLFSCQYYKYFKLKFGGINSTLKYKCVNEIDVCVWVHESLRERERESHSEKERYRVRESQGEREIQGGREIQGERETGRERETVERDTG